MSKYHIGENGPAVCRASKYPCPVGGDHYDNAHDAIIAFENQMGDAGLTGVSKQSPTDNSEEREKKLAALKTQKDFLAKSLKVFEEELRNARSRGDEAGVRDNENRIKATLDTLIEADRETFSHEAALMSESIADNEAAMAKQEEVVRAHDEWLESRKALNSSDYGVTSFSELSDDQILAKAMEQKCKLNLQRKQFERDLKIANAEIDSLDREHREHISETLENIPDFEWSHLNAAEKQYDLNMRLAYFNANDSEEKFIRVLIDSGNTDNLNAADEFMRGNIGKDELIDRTNLSARKIVYTKNMKNRFAQHKSSVTWRKRWEAAQNRSIEAQKKVMEIDNTIRSLSRAVDEKYFTRFDWRTDLVNENLTKLFE